MDTGACSDKKKKLIHKFSELPEEHQNSVRDIVPNALELDANLEIIVRILQFTAKLKVKTVNARPSVDDKDTNQLDDATASLSSESACHIDIKKLDLNDTKKLIIAARPTFLSAAAKKQIKVKDQAGKGGFDVVFEGFKQKLKITT